MNATRSVFATVLMASLGNIYTAVSLSQETDSCPMEADSLQAASRRLNCSVDRGGYRCLPKSDITGFIEFCTFHRGLIESGHCLVRSIYGYINQISCSSFDYGCPQVHYLDTNFYTFPACLQIDKANQCFVADPTCYADGGWTNFTFSWSPCTVTCGGGIQSGQEHRTCTNPRPSKTGKPCVGSPHGRKASRDCNKQPCPVDGQWSEYGPVSEWSKCSMSCGVGKGIQQRFRKRNCTNPPPQHAGKNCPGSDVHTERKECDVNPCPVDGGWSKFVPFGDWSQCSVTCNIGTKTRFRIRRCSDPEPLYGGKPCIGESTGIEKQECVEAECPVNGAWSGFGAFSDWSECSKTCGGGNKDRSRYRVCNNPSPEHGGKECKGSRIFNEKRTCNTQLCPVHGGWSDFGSYSEWSECPVTCGGGNQKRSRTRKCDNPSPKHNGNNCTGSAGEIESRKCNSNFCPVDGGWSVFIPRGSWSRCSASCNNGSQTRTLIRSCSQPVPSYGGFPCEGQSITSEIQPCNTHLCEEGATHISNQTVLVVAVVSGILTILLLLNLSILCHRKEICKREQSAQDLSRDDVYEEIGARELQVTSHDYVSSYTEYVPNPHIPSRPDNGVQSLRLPILTENKNENDSTGEATPGENEISNVSDYEEPTAKTRNSYIIILPDNTDLDSVGEEPNDFVANYEDDETANI